MGIREILNSLLESEEKRAEIHVDETVEFFKRKRRDQINQAEKRKEELKNTTDRIIKDLNKSLELVKSFDDKEDLDIVEDVAESFYNKRKNLVKDLDLDKEFETHLEEFSEFVEEFNDVSRKEGAVLNRIEKQDGSLQDSIESMINHKEELEDFKEDHQVLKRMEEVEKDLEDIEMFREKIHETSDRIQELEKSRNDIKEKLEKKRRELENLRDSDEMDRKNHLKEEIGSLKSKKDRINSSINQDLSLIERGLKKALYEIENGKAEFSGNTEELRNLMNKNLEKTGNVEKLDEVNELIDRESLLDERQEDKFEKGVRKLSDLKERVSRMKEISDEIESLKDEKNNLEIKEKEKNLEDNIENLKDSIEDIDNEVEDLKGEKISLEEDLKEKVLAMEEGLNSHLGVEVELESDSISRKGS